MTFCHDRAANEIHSVSRDLSVGQWAWGLGHTTGITNNGISWIGSRYSISTCDITCSVFAMKQNLETIAHTNTVDNNYSDLERWPDTFLLIERITRSASW